ncbi:MAG: hypothetical protein AWU57_951 [Marinobacter sp. T13-3]|nr:MAG: hypothetical protein AWU57_951 [Marinobacter sp. T13-3]
MTSNIEVIEGIDADGKREVTVACPLCQSENNVNASGYRANNSGVFVNGLTYGVECNSCQSDFGFKAAG